MLGDTDDLLRGLWLTPNCVGPEGLPGADTLVACAIRACAGGNRSAGCSIPGTVARWRWRGPRARAMFSRSACPRRGCPVAAFRSAVESRVPRTPPRALQSREFLVETGPGPGYRVRSAPRGRWGDLATDSRG